MSNPKSESLFHFTRSIDTLLSIIKYGLFPKFCLEDHEWFGMTSAVAYPIVCFCDIPLSRIDEHKDFYGSYGIGLSREWALKNRLEPVIYSDGAGTITEIINYLFNSNSEVDIKDFDREKYDLFIKLMRLIKPIKGTTIVNGAPVEKYFYQENEWRYASQIEDGINLIFESVFEDHREGGNAQHESNVLEISPQDVKYIFVPEDHEIPGVIEFIDRELGHFPHNDVKILTSKIISLKTIESDL